MGARQADRPRISGAPSRATQRNAATPNRAERRQERVQRREERRNASKPAPDANKATQAAKQTLSPRERRAQQRLERNQAQTQKQIDRLQARAKDGKLNRNAQRRLERLQRQQVRQNRQLDRNRQNAGDQKNLQNRQAQQDERRLRRNGQARVTPQAAQQGRFAARFQNRNNANWQARRAARIAARVAARQAWRQNRRATFVAWAGPLFWPYAYSDIFDYTFWPYAYDDAYWAYAYDDFFDSVYWAYGSPYADEYYVGPYEGGMASVVPGARQTARSRELARNVQQLCKDPGKGVTAWPFDDISKAVRASDEQKSLLDDLKQAAARAADNFKASCSDDFAMTPPGRLQAMLSRLNATLDAVRLVRPPLEKFYESLNDEQKARFNAIGPDIGQVEARAATKETQGRAPQDQAANACSESKPGLTNLPIESIEDAVQPRDDQQAALDRLSEATDKAVTVLQAACPDTIPMTPVGRLEVMEKRLDAMVQAAKTVQPALEDFYASLDNEQKARFNTLGKQAERAK